MVGLIELKLQSTKTLSDEKLNKDEIRFSLNELIHIRRALDKYIDNYKSESHPDLILDEQHRIYNSMLEVQDKVKRVGEVSR